jgi:hypothetical protein
MPEHAGDERDESAQQTNGRREDAYEENQGAKTDIILALRGAGAEKACARRVIWCAEDRECDDGAGQRCPRTAPSQTGEGRH